jgi:hypothetical protein
MYLSLPDKAKDANEMTVNIINGTSNILNEKVTIGRSANNVCMFDAINVLMFNRDAYYCSNGLLALDNTIAYNNNTIGITVYYQPPVG